MKFDVIVGNPPYQGKGKQQIYTDFYLAATKTSDTVSLIFPTGWQNPKNANNLRKLNKIEIKEDPQIVQIDNRHNVFEGIPGAEWTNIILWKKGYNNGLEGKQLIYTNGENPIVKKLLVNKAQIVKPNEIMELKKCVTQIHSKQYMEDITSPRKPYGLSTDFVKNPMKYDLPSIQDTRNKENDIELWTGGRSGRIVKYLPYNYPLPSISKALYKFKVFVPYAWGNWDESTGLGGAYSDIIIASPGVATTETWLESGVFETHSEARKHAKYLMTRFLRALLYVNKFSQHSTTAWGAIPVQDYTEDWWDLSVNDIDNQLFKKYSVPEHVVDYIKNNIQFRDENNIINYYL